MTRRRSEVCATAYDLTVALAEQHHPRQDTGAAYSGIRTFRVEQWSDFTAMVKGPA